VLIDNTARTIDFENVGHNRRVALAYQIA